jgi:hypothetical protein
VSREAEADPPHVRAADDVLGAPLPDRRLFPPRREEEGTVLLLAVVAVLTYPGPRTDVVASFNMARTMKTALILHSLDLSATSSSDGEEAADVESQIPESMDVAFDDAGVPNAQATISKCFAPSRSRWDG